MPNWCSNKFQVTGEPDKLAVFLQALGDERSFSFNALFPMPKELQSIVIGGKIIDDVSYSHWIETPDGSKALTEEHKQELRDKYGSIDWYSWSVENWGTKWDVGCEEDPITLAGDPQDGKLYCYFDTAWCPPNKFLKTISTKYPDLEFSLYYAEGGAGFYGSYIVKNGEGEELFFENFWRDAGESEDPEEDLTGDCNEFIMTHGLHRGG